MEKINLLIPMAGAGSRFQAAGYTTPKPLIPLTDRHTGEQLPMVVAAVRDIPFPGEPIFLLREGKEVIGTLKGFYPDASFLTVDHLTQGQASTCLLAKSLINNDTPLFIGACDLGMDVDREHLQERMAKADAIIFTFRNHSVVLENPAAYGGITVNADGAVQAISVKKSISDTPMNDHVFTGAFWFRKGSDFVRAAETMIAANDRINNEFYVDQAMNYLLADKKVYVCEVKKYICWGTPEAYTNYEKTLRYWRDFHSS